ncbi:hypothetical protein F0562_010485 [Nyssa sinensis]|uniref:VQ domain-containing protein n=1 Tax=Nyssa sinensis TaxID=561372 RepID=A0A5J5A1L9_9ASTE|nr:hypothetical protein F0562_010485 [Nyssa sinensis]
MSGGNREPTKIVIINTQYVETDAVNFKSVVQRLTGKDSTAGMEPRSTGGSFSRKATKTTSRLEEIHDGMARVYGREAKDPCNVAGAPRNFLKEFKEAQGRLMIAATGVIPLGSSRWVAPEEVSTSNKNFSKFENMVEEIQSAFHRVSGPHPSLFCLSPLVAVVPRIQGCNDELLQ